MIVAGYGAAGSYVVNADVAELALALPIFGDESSAVRGADGTLGRIRAALPDEEIDARDVVVLVDVVGEMVELIAEFNVVSAPPSALDPAEVDIDLRGLVGIVAGEVGTVGDVEETAGFLINGGKRISESVLSTNAIRGEVRQGASRWKAEIVIVLKVIAEAGSQDETRSDAEVCADAGCYVWRSVANEMSKGGRRHGGANVLQAVRGIRKWEILAVQLLQLIEPGAEQAKTIGGSDVDAGSGVVSLDILAKRDRTAAGNDRAIRGIQDFALELIEFRIESGETEYAVLQNGSAKGEARKDIAGLIVLRDIFLKIRISLEGGMGSQGDRLLGGSRVVATVSGSMGVQGVIFEIGEYGAVVVVGSLFHDNVDDAAESATVFGLNAGVLDFDFIDKVERNGGAGIAADEIGRFLTFDEVRIFRVRAASDGETARSGASRAIARITTDRSVAQERLISRGGSKLND